MAYTPVKESKNPLLTDTDSAVLESKNLLTRLWRIILRDIGINQFKWNDNMERYLNNPANGVPNTKVDRSNKRGNLTKDLVSDKLTWRAFVDCLRWLNPVQATFTVDITWRNRKVTRHSVILVDQNNLDQALQNHRHHDEEDEE